MKSFMKWPHIDNLYQFDRDQLLADYGDIEFAVTEKLDGCNVCLSCDFSQPNVRTFSRNGEDWTNSKDLQPALNRVMPLLSLCGLGMKINTIRSMQVFTSTVSW